MSLACRAMYRLLLRMHPGEFRAEFGDEMLWLFDEEMRSIPNKSDRLGRWMFLMLDGARSALIQRVFRNRQKQQAPVMLFTSIEFAGRFTSIAQGGFLIISVLFFTTVSILLFLEMVVPNLRP